MTQVFFVCGSPKSGTTWLQRILDAHPAMMCSGEGHFYEKFVRPLVDLLREYNRQMTLVGGRVYEGKPYYPLVEQDAFQAIARRFILDRLTLRGPSPDIVWVGDKTPRYTQALGSLRNLFPDARFVNIVRDPRDVAMSRLFHARRANYQSALDPGSEEQLTVTRFGADDWVRSVEPIARFSAAHPGQLYTLRYEDLSADFAGTATRLFDFFGVASDPATVQAVAATTSFEAQSGRKAGEESADSHLRKGVVGDWVGRLDAQALAIVEEVCGPLMQAQGYHLSRQTAP
jgi:hypothetical protein